MTEKLTRVWQYWETGTPASWTSCEHKCLCSPDCDAQFPRVLLPGGNWRSRSWCCGKQSALQRLPCSPETHNEQVCCFVEAIKFVKTDLHPSRKWTNHFPQNPCSNVIRSYFLYVTHVNLLHSNHKHHPNQPDDLNL